MGCRSWLRMECGLKRVFIRRPNDVSESVVRSGAWVRIKLVI